MSLHRASSHFLFEKVTVTTARNDVGTITHVRKHEINKYGVGALREGDPEYVLRRISLPAVPLYAPPLHR